MTPQSPDNKIIPFHGAAVARPASELSGDCDARKVRASTAPPISPLKGPCDARASVQRHAASGAKGTTGNGAADLAPAAPSLIPGKPPYHVDTYGDGLACVLDADRMSILDVRVRGGVVETLEQASSIAQVCASALNLYRKDNP